MTLLILAVALLTGVLAGGRLDMPASALGLFAAASALLAVLLATHDPLIAGAADRVLRMRDGVEVPASEPAPEPTPVQATQ